MKLLTELSTDTEILTEEKDGKKNFYIEGIFMQSMIKNRNGRIYPKNVMERAVNKYMAEKVQNKTAYGELNHPQSPTINLDRVSHLIESLTWDRDNVIGKAKILETPMGEIAKKIMEGGGKLGVSSRGLGSLKEMDGASYVQEDFHLATAADIVSDPSAHDAWVTGVMEDFEWWYNAYDDVYVKKVVEKTHNTVKTITQEARNEFTLKAFKAYLNEISRK